ncbi:MAG: hypothetical protein ACFC03_00875 [Candidatus Malihini olakiniferum]
MLISFDFVVDELISEPVDQIENCHHLYDEKKSDVAMVALLASSIFNLIIVLGIPALRSPGAINPMAF